MPGKARRIVTAVNEQGRSYILSDMEFPAGDIDTALINGPGPRLAVQGQCMAFHDQSPVSCRRVSRPLTRRHA